MAMATAATATASGDGNGGDNGGNGSGDGGDGGDNGNCSNNAKSAQLDIDWGNSGTTVPFKTLTAANLDLDVTNASIGGKHEIQTNPQNINIKSLSTDVPILGAGSGMTRSPLPGSTAGPPTTSARSPISKRRWPPT